MFLGSIVASATPQSSEQDALLIFSATWCGPCQQMAREVWPKVDLSAFKVYHIDIDDNQSVVKQYKVTRIPTIIIGKETNGVFKEEKRKVDSMTTAETRIFLKRP